MQNWPAKTVSPGRHAPRRHLVRTRLVQQERLQLERPALPVNDRGLDLLKSNAGIRLIHHSHVRQPSEPCVKGSRLPVSFTR